MGDGPDRVEKIMGLTLADFHRSVKVLAPDQDIADDQTSVAIDTGGVSVTISFEPRESATLGGLLAMPRALVTICFSDTDETQQSEFLIRFDRAFQRGGG